MENLEKSGESKEFIVIRAWCGKKKEGGGWIEITPEERVQSEKGLKVSHGICPDCLKEAKKKFVFNFRCRTIIIQAQVFFLILGLLFQVRFPIFLLRILV